MKMNLKNWSLYPVYYYSRQPYRRYVLYTEWSHFVWICGWRLGCPLYKGARYTPANTVHVPRKWEVQPMIVLKCTNLVLLVLTWYDLGPWTCTTKLRDVRTWPGLIRGWAYPRDSMVPRLISQDLSASLCVHQWWLWRFQIQALSGSSSPTPRQITVCNSETGLAAMAEVTKIMHCYKESWNWTKVLSSFGQFVPSAGKFEALSGVYL